MRRRTRLAASTKVDLGDRIATSIAAVGSGPVRSPTRLSTVFLIEGQQCAGDFSSGVGKVGGVDHTGRQPAVGEDQTYPMPDRLEQQGSEPYRGFIFGEHLDAFGILLDRLTCFVRHDQLDRKQGPLSCQQPVEVRG